MSKEKIKDNIEMVRTELMSLAKTQPMAMEAAALLDSIFNLNADKNSTFDAEYYLNGEVLHDTAIYRAFAIDKARASDVDFMKVVSVLYEVCNIALGVSKAILLLF